jgi:O-antigen/teichoic acid export membrane protein
MLGSIKVSVRDTLIYGLGNIMVKIVGLILIPLFTNPKYFSVDDFGVLGVLEITGLVLTAILASSLPQSLTRWYWDKDYLQKQKNIFFISFVTQIVVSVVLTSLLIPLSHTFSSLLFGKTDWTKAITWVIIGSGLQAINNIINTLMRLQSKAFLYIATNVFKLVVVLFLTIYLILGKKMGIEGIYLAQVAGNLFFILILLVYSLKNIVISFDWKIFREMNTYGYPLLLANISAVVLNVIDRYSLNSLTILKYVALYTLAFKVTSVLKLVIVDSIKLSVSPLMIKKINDPDNKRFYSKILLYTSFVLMAAIIFVSLFSLELVKVLSGSKQLWQAVTLIPLLSLSVFFVNMKEITVYGLHIVKKTKIIGLIVLVTSIISICLNIAFIPLWDAVGCALATLVSQLIYWAIVYYYSQKNYYIPYENRKLLLLFSIGTVIVLMPLLINVMPVVPRLLLKSGLFISFPFVLAIFGFYDRNEILAIKGFYRKWSKLGNIGANLKSLSNIKDELLQ